MTLRSYDPRSVAMMMRRLGRLARQLEGEDRQQLMLILEGMEAESVESDKSAVERYLSQVTKETPQDTALDRNSWQRRLGALVTLIEAECIRADEACERLDPAPLLASAYRVVNTNPMTGSIDDPYADIAKILTRQTLEACLEAGLIAPGPNAPEWMRDEAAIDDETEKSDEGP